MRGLSISMPRKPIVVAAVIERHRYRRHRDDRRVLHPGRARRIAPHRRLFARKCRASNFNAFIVSSRAYEAGFALVQGTTRAFFCDISQIGSPNHYALALIAEKYQFDLKSLRILPLQSIANIASAVIGGQADARLSLGYAGHPRWSSAAMPSSSVWSGDETTMAARCSVRFRPKSANERGAMLARFPARLSQRAGARLSRRVHRPRRDPPGRTRCAGGPVDSGASDGPFRSSKQKAGIIYIDPRSADR